MGIATSVRVAITPMRASGRQKLSNAEAAATARYAVCACPPLSCLLHVARMGASLRDLLEYLLLVELWVRPWPGRSVESEQQPMTDMGRLLKRFLKKWAMRSIGGLQT